MTSSTELALERIRQVAIPVRELPRATAFYRDVLGLRLLFEVPGMTFLDCGGIRLMLTVPEAAEFDHPASVLYYQVPDIGAAHATLAARGVSFDREPHIVAAFADSDIWMAFFRDSERNLLAITAEVPR